MNAHVWRNPPRASGRALSPTGGRMLQGSDVGVRVQRFEGLRGFQGLKDLRVH